MDDLREIEEALAEIERLRDNENKGGFQGLARIGAYNAAISKVRVAIYDWQRRHTEQNRGLSVEVFDDRELSDNIKSNVCGFGEEE